MGMITKTVTKGFRPCIFRNQPVHQFYGHLQSVLRAISPSGEMEQLFAKPNSIGGGCGSLTEMEWSTDLKGEAKRYQDLPAPKQQEVDQILISYMEKIKTTPTNKQQNLFILLLRSPDLSRSPRPPSLSSCSLLPSRYSLFCRENSCSRFNCSLE